MLPYPVRGILTPASNSTVPLYMLYSAATWGAHLRGYENGCLSFHVPVLKQHLGVPFLLWGMEVCQSSIFSLNWMDLLVHNLQCSDVKCSCASFKFYLFLRCETEPYRQRRYPACVGTWHTMELCMSVYISKFRWVLLKRETWLWQGDILCSRFAVLRVISFHFIHTCENSRYTNGVTYHNGGSGEWQNFISIFKNSEICKCRHYPYICVEELS